MRNHGCFLLLRLRRCFTSPGVAPAGYGFTRRVLALLPVGCPIRKSTDQSVLAAPRGLSQLAASFVALRCQGIRRMPVSACPEIAYAPEWCGLPARRSLRHSSGNSAVKDRKGSKAIGERAMVGASPDMVGVTGVGPVTSSLSGTRSNQLSYTPVKGLREIAPWLALHRTTALRRGGGSVQSGWTWKQGTGHWVGRLMDRHRLSSRYVYKGEARPRS